MLPPCRRRSTVAGDVVLRRFECGAGYRRDAPLVCLDGAFSEGECEKQTCGEPFVNNSADLSACRGREPGQTCPLVCLPGYDPSVDRLNCTPALGHEARAGKGGRDVRPRVGTI